MREIKFRAWHKTYKKMFSIASLHFLDQSLILETSRSRPLKVLFCNVILMQSTGLKDKNGREIYEGDICKVKEDSFESCGEIKIMRGGAFYINHHKFCMKYLHQIHCEVCETTAYKSLLEYYDGWELEVIGNLYENEDLLSI